MPEKYDPNIHHRRSIRIPGYDYSQDGWYFVTICTQNRKYMFGEIVKDQMRLNNAGFIVKTWWQKVTNKFLSVQTDEYVVMPNHFHGIINIVGANPCSRPTLFDHPDADEVDGLGDIVNWFKTMTTNQYIRGVKEKSWPPFPGRLWQRNYYEHIIRSEDELNHFRCYVSDNPANWLTDKENPNANP